MADPVYSNVLFARTDDLIAEVVRIMIDQKVSSVLVLDSQDIVVGILTERDIVRKFTLVEISDKLNRPVSSIMTRGLEFVSLDNIYDQIIKLHLEKRIRHFPILNGKTAKKENIIGIMSITDFLRQHIINAPKNHTDIPSQQQVVKLTLGILAKIQSKETYRKVFSDLGFDVKVLEDFNDFYKNINSDQPPPLLFDMDGYNQNELKSLIPMVRKYKGNTVFATSQPQIVALFRKNISSKNHSIALKPLDISYCSWFFHGKI